MCAEMNILCSETAIRRWITAMFLCLVFQHTGRADTENRFLGNFIDPPNVKRLVAEQITADGEVTYVLLIHDSGNFHVRSAENIEDLESKRFVPGSYLHGRLGDFVWSTYKDGTMYATDISNPIITEPEDELDHDSAIGGFNLGSMIGRKFLTLGVSTDFIGEAEINDSSFSFIGPSFRQEGDVTFGERKSGQREFQVTYRTGNSENFEAGNRFLIEGEVGDDGISRFISLWRLTSDGEREQRWIANVLEVETGGGALEDSVFLPEGQLHQGFVVLANLSNRVVETIRVEPEPRTILLFGRSVRPVTFIIIMMAFATLLPAGLYLLWGRIASKRKLNNVD